MNSYPLTGRQRSSVFGRLHRSPPSRYSSSRNEISSSSFYNEGQRTVKRQTLNYQDDTSRERRFYGRRIPLKCIFGPNTDIYLDADDIQINEIRSREICGRRPKMSIFKMEFPSGKINQIFKNQPRFLSILFVDKEFSFVTWYPKYSVRFRGRFVEGGPSICHEGEIYFNALFQLDDIPINEGRGVLFTSNEKEHSLMLVSSELFFGIDFSNSKKQQIYVVNVAQIKASHGFLFHELKPNKRSFLNIVSRITKVSNALGHFRPIS